MTRDEGCSKRKFTMSVMYRINKEITPHMLLEKNNLAITTEVQVVNKKLLYTCSRKVLGL
jgi:hypothetical protein